MTRKNALPVTRQEDFAAWYQAVIQEADLAEESGVRGCMIMRPWGFGIWERMQQLLDRKIKESGHENCYFPLFIPLSYFAKEAEHVEGFAKEMAVVTHHRLKMEDGALVVDPEAKLEEPLVVRPTSETVIGTAFSRWLQSWRDLPIMVNQWANVVRWEMRTRMFLRTSEFLWQEGHTAHETREQALDETLTILAMYRDFAQGPLAMPVIAGEKPENERFPGAVATYSIEAMMQDGKALQAGTSHYLGQNFAHAQNIRFQDREGQFQFAHTTSWGVSTRLVGGVIMTHGDDDGLRVPPQVAPHQIVIIPMLRETPEDAALLEYCDTIRKALVGAQAFGEPLRVLIDKKAGKAGPKRWGWVKKGAPLILEIGGRDAAGEQVTMLCRDALYGADDRLASQALGWQAFVDAAPGLLVEIEANLFSAAKARLDANVRSDVTDFDGLKAHFGASQYPGWVAVDWSRPTGDALDGVVERLKSLKLTIRNTPEQSSPSGETCFFTGEPAVERVLLARAY
ncbi:proline--tRNA ligase [Blastomonas sp.]|uniref:proline--tRNA ligase n=1 Tax=Blastomonas sp. TaxID=1909299 RepID=UPI003593D701